MSEKHVSSEGTVPKEIFQQIETELGNEARNLTETIFNAFAISRGRIEQNAPIMADAVENGIVQFDRENKCFTYKTNDGTSFTLNPKPEEGEADHVSKYLIKLAKSFHHKTNVTDDDYPLGLEHMSEYVEFELSKRDLRRQEASKKNLSWWARSILRRKT